MAKKAKINVEIGAKTKGLEAGLNKAKSKVNQFGASTKAAIGGRLAAAAGGAALVALTKKIVTQAAEVQHLAERWKISAEEVQAWQAAGQDAGTTTSEINTSLVTLRKQQQNAINGSKEAQKAFSALGITMDQVANASMSDLIEMTAKGIIKTGDMGNGFKLMGESAARVEPILRQISEQGMGGLTESMREAGRVMDNEFIAKMEVVDTKLGAFADRMETRWARLMQRIVDGAELISDVWTAVFTDATFAELDAARKRSDAELMKGIEERRKLIQRETGAEGPGGAAGPSGGAARSASAASSRVNSLTRIGATGLSRSSFQRPMPNSEELKQTKFLARIAESNRKIENKDGKLTF